MIHDPVEGNRLLGQRQRTGGSDPFSSPIQVLTWNGNEYIARDQFLPGGKANLLGMAAGDVMNNKNEAIVALSKAIRHSMEITERGQKKQCM